MNDFVLGNKRHRISQFSSCKRAKESGKKTRTLTELNIDVPWYILFDRINPVEPETIKLKSPNALRLIEHLLFAIDVSNRLGTIEQHNDYYEFVQSAAEQQNSKTAEHQSNRAMGNKWLRKILYRNSKANLDWPIRINLIWLAKWQTLEKCLICAW